jgi:hypothetical protein
VESSFERVQRQDVGYWVLAISLLGFCGGIALTYLLPTSRLGLVPLLISLVLTVVAALIFLVQAIARRSFEPLAGVVSSMIASVLYFFFTAAHLSGGV